MLNRELRLRRVVPSRSAMSLDVRPFGQPRKIWMMRFGKSVISALPCCECRGWRGHSGFARRLIAVPRRAVPMVTERPPSRRRFRHRGLLGARNWELIRSQEQRHCRRGGSSPGRCGDLALHEPARGAVSKAIALTIDNDCDLQSKRDLLLSISGVGETLAGVVLAELPGPDVLRSSAEVVAYAGLNPRQHQSGTSIDRATRISKIGNAVLRAALYMPALSAMRYNSAIVALVSRLKSRGRLKPKQIVVAAMRKLLVLCFAPSRIINSSEPPMFEPSPSPGHTIGEGRNRPICRPTSVSERPVRDATCGASV